MKNPTVQNAGFAAALFTALLFLPGGPASAQNESSDLKVRVKLQTVQRMLEQAKPNAGRWWYGWLIGYGAATLGQGAAGLASGDKSTRQDMFLGAATTGLGAAGVILSPMPSVSAPARFAGLPENTPGERAKKLESAVELLKACALREKEGRSWKTHALAGVVDLGSALVVRFGFKRSVGESVVNFALNTAVAEAQIFTQPTRAMDDYEEFLRGDRPENDRMRLESKLRWCLNRSPGGIGIRIEW
jgi:hypothetical protein